MELGAEAMGQVGWLVGWSASLLSLSGRMKGAESTEGPGRKLMSHAV